MGRLEQEFYGPLIDEIVDAKRNGTLAELTPKITAEQIALAEYFKDEEERARAVLAARKEGEI